MAKPLRQILNELNASSKRLREQEPANEFSAIGDSLKLFVVNVSDDVQTKQSVLEEIIDVFNTTDKRLIIHLLSQ